MLPDSFRWVTWTSRAAKRRFRRTTSNLYFILEPLEERICLSIAAPATYAALMSSGVPDPTPVTQAPVVGKTYYVQPGGSDSNNGLGSGANQAWATINHAVAELQPGDTVYVAPGTYNGTVDIADYGNSGTANASINYIANPTASHFSGITPGNVEVTGGTAGFLIGKNYILVSGFDITGSTLTTGINVELANPTSGWVMGTSILNNTIQNLSGNNATAINLTGANNGRSTSNTEPWAVINTTIQGNTIDNISGEGIEAAGVWDFRVNANTIYDVADRGIDVNTLDADDNMNVFITNNLVYSVRNGITAADVVTNPVETWAGGWTGGPWTYGLVIENNTVVLDNVEAVGTTAGVPDPVRWGIRSSRKEWPNVLEYVANNIIVSNQSNVSDYLFENHDLHPSASILHYYIVPDGELGYNDVYNPEGYIGFENQIANETIGSFSTVTPSEYFSTLASWRSEWGWDYGSISADPQFVNAAAGDYQLSAGSPAIDAGDFDQSLFFVGAYDLNGNPRISNGRIDMGAYAYASTSPAPVPTAPAAPSNLQVTFETTVDGLDNLLNWTINSTNEDGFHVQQSLNGINWQPLYTAVGEGVNNTYAPVLLPNTTYYYRVQAFNAGGESAWSNVVSVTTSGPPSAGPPPNPTNLCATIDPDGTQIDLYWLNNDEVASNMTIYRSTDGVNFTPLTTLIGSTNVYDDTSVTPGVTYYYRLMAYNDVGDSGVSNIASASITGTPAVTAPAPPLDLIATAASATQINLGWVLADDTDTSVALYRSTNDINFAALTTLAAGATTYSDTSVAGSTMYYYYVDAVNSVGPSGNSNTASAQTPAAPTVPGTPTNLTAAAASSSQINLAWTLADSTDTSVELYRSTNGSSFSALTTLDAGTTAYTNTGLAGSTMYYYYVDAVNGVGPSDNSNTASAKTPAAPAVPGTPTNLNATAVSSSQINLAWTLADSTDTSVALYRSTNDSSFSALATLSAGSTSYSDTSVTSSTTYYYYVDALNAVGPSSNSNTASAVTPAPSGTTAVYLSSLPFVGTPVNGWGPVMRNVTVGAGNGNPADSNPLTLKGVVYPLGLGVHAYSSVSFALNGQYSAFESYVGIDDEVAGDPGSVYFQVWGDGVQLYESPLVVSSTPTISVNVNVTGVQLLTLIVVQGGSTNAFDHSDWAAARVIPTGAPVPTAPGDPTNLSATAASSSQINLTWTLADSTDTSVELYRSTNGSSFSPLTTLAAGTTSYSDIGLTGSSTYYYYVEAVNSVGPSGNSNTASAQTSAAPTVPGAPTNLSATAASSSQINLTWTLADSTDTSVELYRSTNGSSFSPLTSLAAGATSYSDTDLTGSSTYYYYVEAVNSVGPSGNSNTASAQTSAVPTVPGAPTNLSATAASSSQINLTWTLADGTDTSVELYRSTNGSSFSPLTSLAAGATSYSDTGLAAFTTYYYYVEAVNGVGPSGNSNTASAVTQATTTESSAVYLSTLPFLGISINGWGPVMRNVTVGAGNGNPADSNPLTLKGVVYPSGLGVHAYSLVSFALNGQYSTFESYIGLDDEVAGDPGSVYFQVWGDGVQLYESPLVVSSTPTISVNVNVAGVQTLTLIVVQGGSTNAFDHSDWAEARVIPNGVPIATVPGTPTNLVATATSSSQINLSWTLADSTDTSIQINRSTNNVTFTPLATLAAGATSYSDTGLASSTTYYYEVSAINAVGPSIGFATANATTQEALPPPSSDVTYLSNLPFVGTPINGWGPVMRNVTVGAGNGNPADSNPLTLKGVVYPEGLGVHPYSSVTFALDGQYTTFESAIGIDDEVAQNDGSVYFQVWGDGVELYSSPLVTAATPTISVNVSVTGVQQLTLIVIQGGSTNAFDHSDWAGALLLS